MTEQEDSSTGSTPVDRGAKDHPSEIGPFRILDVLGEGGMAVVYLADQTEPVKRRVALKIVKLGMDSRQVVARFESERQALAVLDHPNIAKVFDGGITKSGRPYFVMELVKGVPITDFCDDHRFNTDERIALFATVCAAVQHAHHKGLIHRDLKPSNILVGMVDGAPHVKIIDFGIAKATSTHLTEKTLFTKIGQMIGTPDYMSPEQAELTGLDVDTRADIYSLGVILYELLIGVVPLDLSAVGDQAMRVALVERDASKPSTRITELGDTCTEIARARSTDPGDLRRELKGDLDWIVMKAIEKNRARRYQTANALAMECERYLNREPVLARPPSAGYILRRFMQRNKVGVTAGAVALTAIVVGAIAAAVGLVQATQARAEMEEVVEFLVDIFYISDPDESLGNTITAREILDRGSQRINEDQSMAPLTRARMLATIGGVYESLGLYERAQAHDQQAYDIRRAELGPEHEDTLASLEALAGLALFRGEYERMEALSREALRINRDLYGDEDPRTISSLSNLATARSSLGDTDTAVAYSRQALEAARASSDVTPEELEVYVRRAAIYLDDLGESEEAGELYRESLRMSREIYGDVHTRVAFAIDNLAIHYDINEEFDNAEPLYRQVLTMLHKIYGDEHPEIGQSMGNVGSFLVAANGASGHGVEVDVDEARSILDQALAMNRKLRPGHPFIGDNLTSLGTLEKQLGRYEESTRSYRDALQAYSLTLKSDHPKVVSTKIELGETLLLAGDVDGAERLLLESEEALTDSPADRDSKADVIEHLLKLYQTTGDPQKVRHYEKKLAEYTG